MRTLKTLMLLVLVAFMSQSCATLIAGSKSPVKVTGTPEKAKVYYNGNYVGQTPVNVKVPRGKNGGGTIKVEAENYNSAEMQVSHRISLGYVGLDILTGIVPLAVDFATGSIYAPYPKKIEYNLEPKTSLTSKFAVGTKVLILDDKYKNIEGVVTAVSPDGATVKFTRPATALEKSTKKTDKITEEKKFPFTVLKKINN